MAEERIEEEVKGSGSIGRVSLITLASRLLGLARELLKANYFGTSHAADAFNVGFMIPNLLRRVLAEGVMSAAIVPVLTDYQKDASPGEVRDFVAAVLGTLLLLLVIIVSAGVAFAPWYIPLFFPRFDADTSALTSALTAVMFPYIGFVSLAALFQSVLNCHGRFSLPAANPLILNVCIIAVMLAFAPRGLDEAERAAATRVTAFGVLLGGFAQAAMLLPSLFRLGYRRAPRVSFAHPGLRRVGTLVLPVFIGAGVYQINAVVSLVLAALLRIEGAIAALQFSNRLIELTLGVFVVAVITVTLPGLARLWREGGDRFFAHSVFAFKLILLISVPAGAGLLVLRHEIITVLFRHGNFNAQSCALTEFALLFHAASVPLTACTRFFAQAFYAARDGRTPLRIGIAMALANIAFSLALLAPLKHGGIALAMTLAGAVGVAYYIGAWRRTYGLGTLRGVAPFAARALGASLFLALVYQVWNAAVWPFPENGSRALQAAHVSTAIVLGVACYFAALRALGVRNLGELLGVLMRRSRAPRRAEPAEE